MIKMKSGVYGAKDNMRRLSDGPFSLPDDEEARLVRRGVAEYVFDLPVKTVDESGDTEIPKYDVGMTEKQLRGIAAYFNVDVSSASKKQDIVDILDRHFSVNDDAGDDVSSLDADSDAPDLGAADPVV